MHVWIITRTRWGLDTEVQTLYVVDNEHTARQHVEDYGRLLGCDMASMVVIEADGETAFISAKRNEDVRDEHGVYCIGAEISATRWKVES